MEAINNLYEQLWKREEAKITESFLQRQRNKKFLAQQLQQDISELKESNLDLEDLQGIIDIKERKILTKDKEHLQGNRVISVICSRVRKDI